MSSARLLSWGNYPRFPQTPTRCHWRGALQSQWAALRQRHGTTLAYGSGLSYGDSCLAASDHVLHMRALDSFIAADWATGVLTAEAGVTLEEILSLAIPRGWFLPVTPGTKYVTLGGAIANDVHGKNHHRRGTFGQHVRRFGLLRSDTGRVTCSPEEQGELFNATIGGLGMTGLIEWAQIALVPIYSSHIDCTTQRFDRLDDLFALSAQLDPQHEFSVAWIDCAAKGRQTGRGVYTVGDFSASGPLEIATVRKLAVPTTPPFSLISGPSLRAFNRLYWRKAPVSRKRSTVDYERFFYPLDAILKWNRFYGPNGFQQYQALIPAREARAAILAMLTAVASSRTGSFLTVLKCCGDARSPGLLSFPQAGTSLALDFPHTDHLEHSLFQRLDAIVRESGGRLYPAKDAHMSGEDFRRSYPAWQQVEALRDPALMSRFWKRVTQ